MRRGWLSLLVPLAGGVVHADEPAKTPDDLEAEIAWARATWPEDLKDLHFHAPLAKLLAWAPRKGTTPAYLYTNDFACQRLELSRSEPDEPDPDTWPELTGRINGPFRKENGRPIREVTFISIGQTLSRENGTAYVEQRDADGVWQLGGGGIGLDPTIYGALSSVNNRVARFDGNPQTIQAYCGGPTEWLSCLGGGEHPCGRCDQIALMVIDARSNGWSVSRGDGGRAITCHDRCPTYPVSPDLARIQALNARTELWLWRSQKTPLAAMPSLYKSRDDCLREHPSRGKSATGGEN